MKVTEGRSITTFAIGGKIPNFMEVHSLDQLKEALNIIASEGPDYKVIGAGSNVLISDEGLSSFVVRLGKEFSNIEDQSSGRFYVGGATSLMSLSRKLSDAGYAGLEFAGGIPASVGGAVFMNAGAHGGEMCNIIESVDILTENCEVVTLKTKEINYSYRTSHFPKGSVVIGATIKLIESSKEETSRLRSEHLAERKKRQPLTMPSAGSVFRNPSIEHSAGSLIEQVGLRGFALGGAIVSEMHGNWIVNPKKEAKAIEVISLIEKCKEEVMKKFKIALKEEVIFWKDPIS